MGPLPHFLSLFHFLSFGLVYVGVGGLRVGGLGTIGTLGAMVLLWDSSREISYGNLFSITIPSGTSIASWSSLTRVVAGCGLSPSSSNSSVQ